MKKKFLYIPIIASLFFCIAYYFSVSLINKSKTIRTFYDNGNLLSKVDVLDDVKHGREIIYYENGNLKSEHNYENNLLSGMGKHYYENGNLKHEHHYQNNHLSGMGQNYYENGCLKSKNIYVNDVLNGIGKYYYETGELKSEVMWENGEERGYSIIYDKFGKKLSYVYYSYFGNLVFRVNYSNSDSIIFIEGNPLINVYSLEDDFNKMNDVYDLTINIANPPSWNSKIRIGKVDTEKEGIFLLKPDSFIISGLDTTFNYKFNVDTPQIIFWKIEQEFEFNGNKEIVTNYIISEVGLDVKNDTNTLYFNNNGKDIYNYNEIWLDTDVW